MQDLILIGGSRDGEHFSIEEPLPPYISVPVPVRCLEPVWMNPAAGLPRDRYVRHSMRGADRAHTFYAVEAMSVDAAMDALLDNYRPISDPSHMES